jgi:hypothetical protein
MVWKAAREFCGPPGLGIHEARPGWGGPGSAKSTKVFSFVSFVLFVDSFPQVLQQFVKFANRQVAIRSRLLTAEEAGADPGGAPRQDVDLPVSDVQGIARPQAMGSHGGLVRGRVRFAGMAVFLRDPTGEEGSQMMGEMQYGKNRSSA